MCGLYILRTVQISILTFILLSLDNSWATLSAALEKSFRLYLITTILILRSEP